MSHRYSRFVVVYYLLLVFNGTVLSENSRENEGEDMYTNHGFGSKNASKKRDDMIPAKQERSEGSDNK